jgi:type II secretory pathway pseudopilin PulG
MIELVAVLSIMGCTIAIAAPKLLVVAAAADLRSAQSALASNVARARAIAIQRRRTTRLTFAGSTVTTVVDPLGTPVPLSDTLRLDRQYKVTASLTDGSTAPRTLDFDARGIGTATGLMMTFRLDRQGQPPRYFCVYPSGMIPRSGCGA